MTSLNVLAATTVTDDEQATFGSTQPDVFILLDATGTMQKNPIGDNSRKYGATTACVADTTNCDIVGKDCSGGFCKDTSLNCAVDCSRLAIAKRAIYSVLNYNKDSQIDNTDAESLNVRVGAGFYDKDGYHLLRDVGANYQAVMCGNKNNSHVCNETQVATNSCYDGTCVAGVAINAGGTYMVSALNSAKSYYDATSDNAENCRQKFIILITDGAENRTCPSSSPTSDCQLDTVDCQNRRQAVLAARAIANASKVTGAPNYKLFVIGFANGMPAYLTNTLNWMAFWGDPAHTETNQPTATIKPSNLGTLGTCSDAATAWTAEPACQTSMGGTTIVSQFYASENDPGYESLSGYAYIADSASSLSAYLTDAISAISGSTYSFTQSSIQAVRDSTEPYLYEASFNYTSSDPFWIGHLKRYGIDSSGTISTTADWDAGTVLQSAAASGRNIKTFKGGSTIDFAAGSTTTTVTATDLGANNATEASALVNFIRGGESDSSYTYYQWKLGDVFHASPLTIGTPNALFYDQWDSNDASSKAFSLYRIDHPRTSAAGTRLILLGANDGQMHLFKTSDGSEVWSFLPPNLLPKLRYIAHTAHPPASLVSGVSLGHQYFVDGPIGAAEIWIDSVGTGTLCSSDDSCPGVSKSKDDWYTYFVLSEGRGGKETLWSNSTSCNGACSTTDCTGVFQNLYSSTFKNYCGYWAFDISNTTGISAGTANPELKWRLGWKVGNLASSLTAQDGLHLGQPWSKMFIGRVRINNQERWVGLIGGGYSGSHCNNAAVQPCSNSEAPGKGFFVVDMKDGAILWRATHNDGAGNILNANMDYDMAAAPAAIDTDNDGFMDVAYLPDTGGNVWRFKFCTRAMDADPYSSSCGTSDWSASEFYNNVSGEIMPIYTSVTAAKDPSGQLWIYFGSGDKTDPTAPNAQENFYAIKEDLTSTFTISDLDNIGPETGTGVYDDTSKAGWYITFSGHGEKILSDPMVYDGIVYFTTYTPASTSDPCDTNGTSKIYGVDYMTGNGIFEDTSGSTGVKSQDIGSGLATGVTVSRGDVVNILVSKSTGNPHTINVPNTPNSNAASNSIIYWHDKRVQ